MEVFEIVCLVILYCVALAVVGFVFAACKVASMCDEIEQDYIKNNCERDGQNDDCTRIPEQTENSSQNN